MKWVGDTDMENNVSLDTIYIVFFLKIVMDDLN